MANLKLPLLGREKEIALLQQQWTLPGSHLLVCTGRRRIGKSRLIQEFASNFAEDFFEFQGLAPRKGLTKNDQIRHFSEQLSTKTGLPPLQYRNWSEAFSVLSRQIQKNKKTVIFFDEISWMSGVDPDFPGKLKVAWDTIWQKYPKLMIVLCGSVTSWIEKNIFKDADFMGRISLRIRLKELPISECAKFWSDKLHQVSAFEILKVLALTGGVPRYLEEIKPSFSADANIARMIFTPSGPLFDEYQRVFFDIFDRRALIYKKIVKTITEKKLSFKDICQKLNKQKNGVISEYLSDLENSGFIARDTTFNFDGRATKTSRYRIADNYLRFYLKYITPNELRIKKGMFELSSLEKLSQWDAIMGYQFENTMLNNLELIIESLKIKKHQIITAAPYFQKKNSKNKGTCQIDLLIHTESNALYLCEFKFRRKIGSEMISEMMRKVEVLKYPVTFSIRPVLIYEGELTKEVLDSDYFYQCIRVGDWIA
ncbi:MAG: AAA family ATPase [Deltaproteobacteria bacterium]|nr:AAA family ATPase [Deltaproteobacteria bacterium]